MKYLKLWENFIIDNNDKMLNNFEIFERHYTNLEVFVVDIRTKDNIYSSSDKKVHYLGNNDKAWEIISQNFVKYLCGDIKQNRIEISGEIYNIDNILLCSKEEKNKIYELLLSNGFSDNIPDFLKDYTDKYILSSDIVKQKEREDKEYVLTKQYPRKHETKDYVGGFDLDIFFEEVLISYVERGLVFGYIGHNSRKKWVDRLLAEICLPYIKQEDFANWLTSTNGRHFGDAIEDMVDNNDRKGVMDYIKGKLAEIHDLSIIYNSPEHKGNYKSTKDLFQKYKNLDMMMGDSI